MIRSLETTDFAELVAEAAAAERAGVFDRTELNLSALMADSEAVTAQVSESRHSRVVRVYERIMVGLPLAACLGLVIGLATLASRSPDMHGNQFALLGSNGAGDTGGSQCDVRTMFQCLSGPDRPVSAECGAADLDADGDVDMLDIGSFQRLASMHQ